MDLFVKLAEGKNAGMEIEMKSKYGFCLLLLITVIMYSTIAEAASGVWCVGDSQKVKPYDAVEEKNIFWDSDERVVKLYGAKNEYVAFQIIVNADGEKLQDINIQADDFKSGDNIISKDYIDLFKEHYLKVTVPSSYDAIPVEDAGIGEYPTQMVPFRAPRLGAPFDVEDGRNQPVWVDVYISEDAVAGEYESYFTVTAGGKEGLKIKVILTVWDFMLPHETHFKTYIYYGSEQIQSALGYQSSYHKGFRIVEDRFFQMARQHRLNLCPNIELKWGWKDKEFDTYLEPWGPF